jgi:hypothetical protein
MPRKKSKQILGENVDAKYIKSYAQARRAGSGFKQSYKAAKNQNYSAAISGARKGLAASGKIIAGAGGLQEDYKKLRKNVKQNVKQLKANFR